MNTILMSLIMMTMTYEMPKLPYANNALEPVISQQTIDFHYGKHLQTYVNNLNSLVPGTEYEGKTVEEIVAAAPDGAIFNNAGQVLNHNLYFLQFAPKPSKKEPAGKLGEAIKRDGRSFPSGIRFHRFYGFSDVHAGSHQTVHSSERLPAESVRSIFDSPCGRTDEGDRGGNGPGRQ